MTDKKDPILVALGNCPKKWNRFLLKNYRLPEEPQSRNVVSESKFVDENGSRVPLEDVAARRGRIREELPKGLLKVRADDSRPEGEASEQWRRSQAFMRVMVCILAQEKKLAKEERVALLKDVDDLHPQTLLPIFPEVLGTPDQFLERWTGYEFDVLFVCKDRDTQMFEIRQYSIPPDQDEDLDEADEPNGHWEGRTWIPGPPRDRRS